MSHILDELQWRGLLHQSTDEEQIRELLDSPQVIYAGFDPTAASLHCGSLLPVMMLRRFQLAGHKPIALVGGATGMIGDPSGKSEERNLLSEEVLQANVAGLEAQMKRFLDFDGDNAAVLVNNFDWMGPWSYINFLRDVGKNFPVNVMLAKDSVKSRLQREDSGLSYTEFSYMLLQAYDFVHLNQSHQCMLQVGGSDQWGNITAGIDLARRMHGQHIHGLTHPLLLTSDGRKMGKTEKGAIWLDPALTSPYDFHQYWFNTRDDDVLMCLRFLTDVDQEEFAGLEKATAEEPQARAAQTRLADWLTEFIHGNEGLETARKAKDIFFGAEIKKDWQDSTLSAILGDVASGEVSAEELASGMTIVDALVRAGLGQSKSQARRTAEQGGAYVNNVSVPADYTITSKDLASESIVVIRSGKKKFGLLKVLG